MAHETILVVEDDANLLAGIRDILELEHYNVLTAMDGVEAMTMLEETHIVPDLIISDIMMPRMDGVRLLSKVREVDRFVSTPFIYLTAKGEREDVQYGKKLGVDDYVTKPFNATELLIAVRSRLDRAADLNRVQLGRESELKRGILTILNHEFRTPLTFIVAYADMLNEYAGGKSNGNSEHTEMLSFLQGVKSGADRLQYLIENFIMLVELDTGSAQKTLEWRRKPITAIDEVLQAAVNRALDIRRDDEHEHSVAVTVADDLPAFVADSEFLIFAIAHLVDNACKFSPGKTTVKVGAHCESDELCIWVKDRGRGVPADEYENIWLDFYQINREHYEDQGAGSGLAIVKGIAELHGGRVDLESQLGVGSTFKMYIPLTPPDNA